MEQSVVRHLCQNKPSGALVLYVTTNGSVTFEVA